MRIAQMVGWFIVLLGASSAGADVRPVCDIDVLYIARTPRYPNYQPQYHLPHRRNQPTLAERDANGEWRPLRKSTVRRVQRWPHEGQPVTYTAVIENKGAVDAPPFMYEWRIDGEVVAEGRTEGVLPPGERVELSYECSWAFERREVKFWADPLRKVRQWSYANDERTHWTHAKLLMCYVHEDTYDAFAENRNVLGTYSFEDWCQHHADWMNHLFAESRFPETAPEGILDRVCVGHIGVLPDDAAWHEVWREQIQQQKGGWDGAWWFGPHPNCAQWAANMDWGLIHEWGHQLGLTDLYALDLAAERNLVDDGTGNPLLIGRISHFRGTMMHGHGPVKFSEDQAIALNHQLWRRRGYYGDYYYYLARENYIRVLDHTGAPVVGAELRIWQRPIDPPVLHGDPLFTGTTDHDGRFHLPNQDAPHVVTFGATHENTGGGYELHDNPFGLIHVVGPNGIMMIEITARGQRDYAFVEIPQFNIACAKQGADEATVDVPTTLPPVGAAPPPPAPAVTTEAGQVTLRAAGLDEFVVFRAEPPHYDWHEVGEGENGVYTETLPGSGLMRYGICTREGSVRSARSATVGVASLREPWGIAVGPDGTTYVRDRRNGQTLLIKPDGNAVGFIGSVHWHLEGSYDHATDARGRLYIAKWPDGYDPKRSWIRRIDPRGMAAEHDRKDLAGGEFESDAPGRFRKPMGIWIDPQDGRIVVADTGNDRVQILSSAGEVRDVLTGLKSPHKALLHNGRLVVADTGNDRVVVYARDDGTWRAAHTFDEFEEPVYLCLGPYDDVWVADRGTGRISSLVMQTLRVGDAFPPADEPPIDELAGIAYNATTGELLYVDGKARAVKRQQVKD